MRKKYLGLLLFGCFSLLITGCGTEKAKDNSVKDNNSNDNNDKEIILNCSKYINDAYNGLGNFSVEVETRFDSTGNTVKGIDINSMYILDRSEEITDEVVEQERASLESKLCSTEKVSSCKVERKGHTITVKRTIAEKYIKNSQEQGENLEKFKKVYEEETGLYCYTK